MAAKIFLFTEVKMHLQTETLFLLLKKGIFDARVTNMHCR